LPPQPQLNVALLHKLVGGCEIENNNLLEAHSIRHDDQIIGTIRFDFYGATHEWKPLAQRHLVLKYPVGRYFKRYYYQRAVNVEHIPQQLVYERLESTI
jgi:hypothetical protein